MLWGALLCADLEPARLARPYLNVGGRRRTAASRGSHPARAGRCRILSGSRPTRHDRFLEKPLLEEETLGLASMGSGHRDVVLAGPSRHAPLSAGMSVPDFDPLGPIQARI